MTCDQLKKSRYIVHSLYTPRPTSISYYKSADVYRECSRIWWYSPLFVAITTVVLFFFSSGSRGDSWDFFNRIITDVGPLLSKWKCSTSANTLFLFSVFFLGTFFSFFLSIENFIWKEKKMPPPRSRREKERENERPPFLFDHEGLWMAAEVFSLTFKENALETWSSSLPHLFML